MELTWERDPITCMATCFATDDITYFAHWGEIGMFSVHVWDGEQYIITSHMMFEVA